MADKVVNTAKDLGVCQRRHNHANPVIAQRINDRKPYTARVRTLRDLTQAQRSVVLEMGHNSSVFYGAEVDPPTEKQLSEVRRRNHDAIYPANKTQDPHIALALTRTGKADPETYYFSNALGHWRRECMLNINFAEDIADYWQYVREKNGPTIGPTHHAHKILKKLGIHGITPTFWEFEDGAVDITHISDFLDLVLKACRNRAWRLAGPEVGRAGGRGRESGE